MGYILVSDLQKDAKRVRFLALIILFTKFIISNSPYYYFYTEQIKKSIEFFVKTKNNFCKIDGIILFFNKIQGYIEYYFKFYSIPLFFKINPLISKFQNFE